MQAKYRWLQATIEFATTNDLEMPWAKIDRDDWNSRCAARAHALGDG